MKPLHTLFYILLFTGFFLPTNNRFYLPLPGVMLSVRELAFVLLPLINGFCHSGNRSLPVNRNVKITIFVFLFVAFFTELFKMVAFDQSVGNGFKSLRIGFPLFSSLLLLWQGIRVDIRMVWKVLLWAITLSVIISVISIFVYLPIYQNPDDDEVLGASQGRLGNANSSFGLIGLYLLFKDKNKWFNRGKLPLYTAVLSIVSLLLTFNRTYLALFCLLFVYLSFSTFSIKTAFKIIAVPVVFLGIIAGAYFYFPVIQYQVDKRILSIVFDETSIAESTIDDNRDKIYNGIRDRISEGYWVVGMPYREEIFVYFKMGEYRGAKKTDISFINILLRCGIVSLVLFLSFLYKIKRFRYINGMLLLMYILASLNTDALYNQNSIFFICLFLMVNHDQINFGRTSATALPHH